MILRIPQPYSNKLLYVVQMGLGKKFEWKKVRIAEKVELFSSRTFFLKFFLVHMDAEVPQQWQTTHFKACSK